MARGGYKNIEYRKITFHMPMNIDLNDFFGFNAAGKQGQNPVIGANKIMTVEFYPNMTVFRGEFPVHSDNVNAALGKTPISVLNHISRLYDMKRGNAMGDINNTNIV